MAKFYAINEEIMYYHRSNHHSNHGGYYDGYHDHYYDGIAFFLQEYFLDDFLRFSIIFGSFHTQKSSDLAKFWAINKEIMY